MVAAYRLTTDQQMSPHETFLAVQVRQELTKMS